MVAAAQQARVKKVLQMSFLRARPNCGSGYHESKWAAEEIILGGGLDYTILKAGVIYGKGDHMLDHLSGPFCTLPIYGVVGMKSQPVRPAAVADIVAIIEAALLENCLSRQTVAVVGPEEMSCSHAVKRVARVMGKHPLILPMPLFFHYALAAIAEKTMKVPIVSKAQVRILSEGVAEALPPCDQLPDDLLPATAFTDEQIRQGLPEPHRLGPKDCRCTPSPTGACQ